MSFDLMNFLSAIGKGVTGGGAPTGARTPGFVPQTVGMGGGSGGGGSEWMQYLPYALLGMAGAQGGLPGTLGAVGLSTAIDQLKRHHQQKQLAASLPTGPTAQQAGFDPTLDLAKQAGQIPGYDPNEQLAKGGPVRKKIEGGISSLAAKSSKDATAVRKGADTAPPSYFRQTATGRFAKGGLMRAAGVATKGYKFSGVL